MAHLTGCEKTLPVNRDGYGGDPRPAPKGLDEGRRSCPETVLRP
jgi:hypothetical protein